MKRVFDLVISIPTLIVLLPVLLFLAVVIKLDSKGPVIFKQKRSGRNHTLFTIYKFRTMKVDTPDIPTHLLNNPEVYISRVGRILRKTSLDELPQLFNILKGDMSIVGPRPALHNQLELISMREQFNVHRIPPGLTGWAQINGRDDISDEMKAQYDLYYLQNHNLWMDIKIIFRTVSSVASSKGIKA
ncbi:sugar transferase [Cohnella cholangitidis]|uniref:Sugar transferase n=1 Tax=Cohnella cholangitidis TaxID=2598458 RepID=A0A7G5BXN1_9BACL|nr:sugar transferase [Cohnella cholangitidis]QMV41715.1 sugar transferase [Cohnella cholangitidis]